jgi:hypothetical protein
MADGVRESLLGLVSGKVAVPEDEERFVIGDWSLQFRRTGRMSGSFLNKGAHTKDIPNTKQKRSEKR